MTTEEGNKLIAEFIGYYQPTEVQDDLFSFEVYASENECKKDYPGHKISKYHNNDIEDFQFVDEPKFHSSWDWLMPVIGKISNECEEPEELDGLKYSLLCNDIEQAWIFVTDYLASK